MTGTLTLIPEPFQFDQLEQNQPSMMQPILDAMDHAGPRLTGIENDTIGEVQRVLVPLAATRRQHERLCADLNAPPAIDKLLTFRDPEED